MSDRYLTTEEVAETFRTSAETVRYWRHVGSGPESFKVGRRVLYPAEGVERFIAEARGVGESVERIVVPAEQLARIDSQETVSPGLAAAVADAEASDTDSMAERIARRIEHEMQFEGVRAQRVMKMCAHLARKEGGLE